LYTGDQVTGIIDFGAMNIDTPATDVARLLGNLARDRVREWRVGLEAYSSIRPISADESLAISALNTSGNLLAGCNWIRWVYIDERQFEDRSQVVKRFRGILEQLRIA
jgi:homoserine kinase type II